MSIYDAARKKPTHDPQVFIQRNPHDQEVFTEGARWALELAADIAESWSEEGFGFSEEARNHAHEIAVDIGRRLD